MSYLPYQQRVIEEKLELDARLEKLNLFIISEIYSTLPIMEQNRLATQQILMTALSGILRDRIASFTVPEPD